MDIIPEVITDTVRATVTPEPPPPDKPAQANITDNCELCGTRLKDNPDHIFCAWHGPVMGKWLCDECFTMNRGGGMLPEIAAALHKPFMDERMIRHQLNVVRGALRNLAEIKWIEANDAAGTFRSVDLNLTFREARPIYAALEEVLRHKLAQNESFAA